MRYTKIAFGVVIVLLLIVAGVAIYAAVAVNQEPEHHGEELAQRCCHERDLALRVWTGFNNAIPLLTTNPTLSTQIIANYFADAGIWSVPFQVAPFIGPTEIYNFFIGYALNPGENNISVVDRQINWDCQTRTLAMQRTWSAVLTAPRSFTPGSTATLPIGTAYQQDDLVVMRFNCNFTRRDGLASIVYYREYYDNTQYATTYSPLLAPVCPSRYYCPTIVV